jgi:guanylate kinase
VIIISAPSGAGKTTIVHRLLAANPRLAFSISATTRARRSNEQDGRDYYFLTQAEFRQRIGAGEFVEWEEVYSGRYYGTLVSEIERITRAGQFPLFDVDVKGGLALKRFFGATGLACFVHPPSLAELEARLRRRGTDTEQQITDRMQRAEYELQQAQHFDRQIVNHELEATVQILLEQIEHFTGQPAH